MANANASKGRKRKRSRGVKKKQKNDDRQGQTYLSYRDMDAVIRYLDSAILGGFEMFAFQQGAIEYLQRHHGRTFSFNKIEKKLKYAFDAYGKDDLGDDWKVIYQMGSECLKPYACQVDNESQTKSNVGTLRSESTSIQEALAEGPQPSPESQFRDVKNDTASPCAKERTNLSLSKGDYADDACLMRGGTLEISQSRRKRLKGPQYDNTDDFKTESGQSCPIPSIETSKRSDVETRMLSNLGRDEAATSTIPETPSLSSLVSEDEIITVRKDQANCPVDQPGHDCIPESMMEARSYLHPQSGDTIISWQNERRELEYLRTRCTEIEQERDEDRRELETVREMNILLLQPNAQFKLNEELEYRKKEAKKLRALSKKCERLDDFTRLRSTETPKLDVSGIKSMMSEMSRGLRNLLPDDQFDCPFKPISVDDCRDLKALFSKAFGPEHDRDIDPKRVSPTTLGVTLQSVLRCLVAAAICLWVFDADMKDLFFQPDMSGRVRESSELYANLRNLISAKDALLWRNLDLAAHQLAVDGKRFQEYVIPQKAAYLADQALDTLVPVLDRHALPEVLKGSVVSIWHHEQSRLNDVFKLALQVKCKLLISKDRFRSTFWAPGTEFAAHQMRSQHEAHKLCGRDRISRDAVVKLTFFPGLDMVESKKTRVDYNNSISAEILPSEVLVGRIEAEVLVD